MSKEKEAFEKWQKEPDDPKEMIFAESESDNRNDFMCIASGFYGGFHSRDKEIEQLKTTITEVKKFHDRLPSEWFSEQIYAIMEDALNE